MEKKTVNPANLDRQQQIRRDGNQSAAAISRMTWAEWRVNKVWLLLLGVFVMSLLAAPMLVAWEVSPGLSAAARAQVAYAITFLTCVIVVPVMVAEVGAKQRTFNQRIFWRGQGVPDATYFRRMTADFAILSAVIVLIGIVTAFVVGPRGLSLGAAAQAAVLSWMAFLVPLPFLLGLSQRLGAAPTAITGIVINAVGYYVPANADAARQMPGLSVFERGVWETIFCITPQLRVGDQAARITFGWPAIEAWWFLGSVGYLLLWTAVSAAIGYVLWRKAA